MGYAEWQGSAGFHIPDFLPLFQILGGFAPEQKETTTPPSDNPPSLPEPEAGLKCLIPDGAVCRGELLGSGCFGVVHRGLWTLPSGQSVSTQGAYFLLGTWASCPSTLLPSLLWPWYSSPCGA